MVSGVLFMGVGYWLSTPKAERPNLAAEVADKALLEQPVAQATC
ncbi:MAG: hypothetical protein ACI892_001424 [Marinobacter maritimus]|jgi:hypothetical protein